MNDGASRGLGGSNTFNFISTAIMIPYEKFGWYSLFRRTSMMKK
jgi:hypothetical protein